jgi:hypothetical protein
MGQLGSGLVFLLGRAIPKILILDPILKRCNGDTHIFLPKMSFFCFIKQDFKYIIEPSSQIMVDLL